MRTKDRVREYADKHPTATVREIQTALGLSSPSVVQFHLKVDSKDNMIEARDKRIRELEAAIQEAHGAHHECIDALGKANERIAELEAAILSVRKETLEEAARAAEKYGDDADGHYYDYVIDDTCIRVAAAIRAMKEG